MANIMRSIIPMIGLMVVIMIAGSYTTSILSANHDNVNVTGTAYESQYESNTAIQATTLSFSQYVSVFIAIGIFIIGVGFLIKRTKSY